MLRLKQLFTFAIISSLGVLATNAVAQDSLNLGSQLTSSDGHSQQQLGIMAVISGDTVVATDAHEGKVYVFVKPATGWSAMTQTAVLTPSTPDRYFGDTVAISGDTIVVSDRNQAYVFVKPAGGWKNMTETAQLNDGISGNGVAIDGDTILVGSDDLPGVYVYEKPAGGWKTTSAYAAALTAPGETYLVSFAVSGPTVVLSYLGTTGNGSGDAYVFEKPKTGWANIAPTAKLLSSRGAGAEHFGSGLAISGDTIVVGAADTWATPTNILNGIVDLFVKPEGGWQNATETVELAAPGPPVDELGFGAALAMNDSHLVVGTYRDDFFVYSKPTAGWGAFAWPSQEYVGKNSSPQGPSLLGESLGISGDFIVAGDSYAEINGNDVQGAAYVFQLMPNWILPSTDVLKFDNTPNGITETLPLTINNTGTGTLNFSSTLFTQPNFQVNLANSNCSAGVAVGQSCTLPVAFTPAGVGQHTTSVALTSPTSASVRVIQMTGLATGVGPVSESVLNFGTVAEGSSATLPLVLTNVGVPGSPTVTVSFSNSYYSLAPGGTCAAGVPEGQTCTLMIKFAPVTEGYFKGAVTLTPSAGPVASATVFGKT